MSKDLESIYCLRWY